MSYTYHKWDKYTMEKLMLKKTVFKRKITLFECIQCKKGTKSNTILTLYKYLGKI